jgi:hypothetical protein
MTAQVKRNENILMPKDVNPRRAHADYGVKGVIVVHRPVLERVHPSAHGAGGEKSCAIHQ